MELKAIIVDDEPDSRSVLRKLLKQFCPEVRVCAEAGHPESAYEMAVRYQPHIVFLDIQMPGGNGFALLKRFIEVPFEVIFVTSYDQYALEAIRFSALDYLLKPIEYEYLQQSVKKVREKWLRREPHQLQIVNFIAHLEDGAVEKKVAVHNNDTVKLLPLAEITHLQGERNYTVLYTIKGDKFTSSKNLGEFEDMLRNYPQFLRIHKSYIANLNHVTGYSKGEPCILTIAELWDFEISRRKKQEVLERLMDKKHH